VPGALVAAGGGAHEVFGLEAHDGPPRVLFVTHYDAFPGGCG
jgi:hypothetical protein